MEAFYQVCEQAHPTYWWAEPHPAPSDWEALFRTRVIPKVRLPQWVVAFGRHRGHAVASRIWDSVVTDAMRNCNATGFLAYPIRVIHKNKHVPGFEAVSVHGVGGGLDVKRSKATFFEGGVVFKYSGIYMKEEAWDGSDVFCIPELGLSVFVVEHVARRLLELKLKNLDITHHTKCSSP